MVSVLGLIISEHEPERSGSAASVAGRSGMSREKVLGVELLGFARTKRWAAQASVVSVRSGSVRAVI